MDNFLLVIPAVFNNPLRTIQGNIMITFTDIAPYNNMITNDVIRSAMAITKDKAILIYLEDLLLNADPNSLFGAYDKALFDVLVKNISLTEFKFNKMKALLVDSIPFKRSNDIENIINLGCNWSTVIRLLTNKFGSKFTREFSDAGQCCEILNGVRYVVRYGNHNIHTYSMQLTD